MHRGGAPCVENAAVVARVASLQGRAACKLYSVDAAALLCDAMTKELPAFVLSLHAIVWGRVA